MGAIDRESSLYAFVLFDFCVGVALATVCAQYCPHDKPKDQSDQDGGSYRVGGVEPEVFNHQEPPREAKNPRSAKIAMAISPKRAGGRADFFEEGCSLTFLSVGQANVLTLGANSADEGTNLV